MRVYALVVVAATIACATWVNAASLTVTADQDSYRLGSIVTLTVQGVIDPTVDHTTNIDVRLDLSENLTFMGLTAQTAKNPPPTFGPQTDWIVGGTQGHLTGNSVTVFNQLQGLPPGGTFLNNFNGLDEAYVTAEVVLMLDGEGPASADFGASTAFFGLGGGPGWAYPIPEPDAVALMGLGLAGLALAGRRRDLLR